MRFNTCRVCAVELLRLQRGDCVVELGCGTGLNFPLLIEQIGPEGRLVILDGKQPERLPFWLFKRVLWLARPFGVTLDYFDRHTWESVERYFQGTVLEQMCGGMIYVSSGAVPWRTPERVEWGRS